VGSGVFSHGRGPYDLRGAGVGVVLGEIDRGHRGHHEPAGSQAQQDCGAPYQTLAANLSARPGRRLRHGFQDARLGYRRKVTRPELEGLAQAFVLAVLKAEVRGLSGGDDSHRSHISDVTLKPRLEICDRMLTDCEHRPNQKRDHRGRVASAGATATVLKLEVRSCRSWSTKMVAPRLGILVDWP
jgi:hypothetical protein